MKNIIIRYNNQSNCNKTCILLHEGKRTCESGGYLLGMVVSYQMVFAESDSETVGILTASATCSTSQTILNGTSIDFSAVKSNGSLS